MRFETVQQRKKKNIIKFIFIFLASLAVVLIYLSQITPNPLPEAIRNQVTFRVFYPVSRLVKVDSSSYQYDADRKILTFTADFGGHSMSFNEQLTPDALGSDSQPYYQAIGIHLNAQFKVSLGQVALTKFWQSGTLTPNGQSALLSAKGTLLTVHYAKTLSNQDWKTLFETLKIIQ